MTDRNQLAEVYKQNLENDIIKELAKIKQIELRKAFDIYAHLTPNLRPEC